MPPNAQALQAVAAQAEFWKTVTPAAIGLLGVLVGGGIQMITAFILADRQSKQREKAEREERERAAARTTADRNYARAILARHLETYARACAEVMWENRDSEKERDDPATGLIELRDWPDVAWELLGANDMMKAKDIALRFDLQQKAVSEGAWYAANSPDEARDYFAEAAARLGIEAWRLSQEMRREAGVEPFEFAPDGPNFVKSLTDYVAELEEAKRKAEVARGARRAARLAAGEEEDPFD